MNSIERLQKLSGITIVEGADFSSTKKYADRDKPSLLAVKQELQGILAHAARASFKYKNAKEELAIVDAKLKELDEVKESLELSDDVNEGEDKKPAFLKDKEDDSEKDKDSDKDSDKSDKKDDKDDDSDDKKESDSKNKEDDKSKKKESKDKKDKPDFFKKKKEEKCECPDKKEVKESELTIDQIAALILEKDFTPTEIETDYQNGPVENSGVKFEQGTKIRFPNAIRAEVNKRIKELDQAILRYDDKGYNDKSVKQQAIDCLNQILQDLSTNDLEGVKKAQIYFETLMSPLTDFFPPKLINWLANAINPYVGVKESEIQPRESINPTGVIFRQMVGSLTYLIMHGDTDGAMQWIENRLLRRLGDIKPAVEETRKQLSTRINSEQLSDEAKHTLSQVLDALSNAMGFTQDVGVKENVNPMAPESLPSETNVPPTESPESKTQEFVMKGYEYAKEWHSQGNGTPEEINSFALKLETMASKGEKYTGEWGEDQNNDMSGDVLKAFASGMEQYAIEMTNNDDDDYPEDEDPDYRLDNN